MSVAAPVRVLYTAEATAVGGRAGHSRTSDGKVDVDLAIPTEMGGPGGPGTNPEELFAAGYAACFQSSLEAVARREKLSVAGSTVTARVGIGPIGEGRLGLTVQLLVHAPSSQTARSWKPSWHERTRSARTPMPPAAMSQLS